jgi:hypothetical protein
MAHKPVGSGSSIAITSSTSVRSGAFSVQSDTLRVVALSAGAHVAIGTDPTASSLDYFVAAGTAETLALSPATSSISGITKGTITYIDFPEGTGSPFEVGDYVSLVSENQNYYNFTHQAVISVNSTAGYDGYFSTRIGIATNTSGIATAFSTDAVLRKSLKIASYGAGSGALYYQQVQISGNA